EKILQEARSEGAKLLERREREAKQAAERLRIQALARAELESKKIVLSAQKELLDEVYAKVLDRLGRIAESGEWLRNLLQANAAEWRNGKVYCNARDADTVRSIVGANLGGTIDCVGGVVIESADGSHRTDLQFETLLADIWRDSIRDVAEVLWPPH
ncbi:MAG: V-type ATP synthase subunit E family protein, partial [Thermoplasmata archaeon]